MLRSVLLREFTTHPLIFSIEFSSMPFIVGDSVAYCSWDCQYLRVERLLSRRDAYPLSDSWSHCLAVYRKATILPYRSGDIASLASSAEHKRTFAVFRRLVDSVVDYVRESQLSFANTSRTARQYWIDLLEEAEDAATGDEFGRTVARLEVLLSNVHKFLLSNVPKPYLDYQAGLDFLSDVSDAANLEHPDPKKKSVLYLEDEQPIRLAVSDVLEMHFTDYQLYSFAEPSEALKALIEINYSLAIIDIMLPKMDGMAFIRALKESQSDAKIIVLSAKDPRFVNLPQDYSITYIQKPFHPRKLADIIRSLNVLIPLP